MTGTVHGSEGGVYTVQLDSGSVVEASLRGRLKREARTGDKVVIGDRVELNTTHDLSSTIEKVLPRKSEIVRRGPGGRRPKVVAANLDQLVVVMAAARPEPRQVILDRLLVVGEANRLEPAVVMNKIDLITEGDGDRAVEGALAIPLTLYRELGYPVLETSVVSGKGLDHLAELLCSGTSALVGPSGVGKSSLLNAVEPGLGLRIGELSHKKGQGRHTTVSSRLIDLACGGLVADTPGFSDVGVWGADQTVLEGCFPDFHPFREACRFRGCTHLHEPDCSVRDALERGEVQAHRFESYRTLVQEAAES